MVDKDDEEFTITDDTLIKRAKHLNNTVNHFWNRWEKEYLQELCNARRYPSKRQQFSAVQEGRHNCVQDPDLPRGFWKVARVTRLLTGKDGQHRGAVLRVAARGEQETTLQRPLQLLYPLEINCSSDKDNQAVDDRTYLLMEITNILQSQAIPPLSCMTEVSRPYLIRVLLKRGI